MGTLYLVSTPIGNMEDITLRAIRILGEVDIIACEDTRKTGLLLQHLKIVSKPKLLSYYEENEAGRILEIIEQLKNGHKIALVSNAGTPTISDPGFKLVRECLTLGIKVESIPGSSAVLAALTSSGLPTDKFLFLGFLPQKQGKRIKLLENLSSVNKEMKLTNVIYLSPHRLLKELTDIKSIFGDIEVVIGSELTKYYEQIRREKISQSILYYQRNKPIGEFTLVFHG